MAANVSKANSKIAKNTLFLYIRKLLSLLIALYTSRVLLQTLGIDDFGLYGLVGSIVGLFNSLRSLFATSIQRFLNTEKNGNIILQNKIFSTGVTIHIGIAIIFVVSVEITGLIMIPDLNLHPEKLSTAYWLLQFSILSSAVSILTVPYDALLMAKERFDALAAFGLLDSVLRLGVIYLLLLTPFNKVILYSVLLFAVGILIRASLTLYCKHNFKEVSHYRFVKDKNLFRDMTQFAGWNFLGNIGLTLTYQGLNFVLNYYGGVIANAARTIAFQVSDSLRSFVIDANQAFNPQSMMTYANDKHRFYKLQFFSSKLCSSIFLIVATPIYIFTEPILKIWLGEEPQYAAAFLHGLLVYYAIRNWRIPIDVAFKSANKMKWYQICELVLMLFSIPIACTCLYLGAPLYWVFVVMSIIELINLLAILIMAHRQLNFPMWNYIKGVVGPTLYVISLLIASYVLIPQNKLLSFNLIQLILGCGITMAIVLGMCSLFVFNQEERDKLASLFKRT